MTDRLITLIAEETPNLDTHCFRGSAPLAELARLSTADVYDQVTNPDGLQRDLSKKHAREAYEYVERAEDKERPRAYPEIILNVRDKKIVKLEREVVKVGDRDVTLVAMTFDLGKIEAARTPKVSRMDGNHRLYYVAGDGQDIRPIDLQCPFQIHIGLTREQEASIFADVNAEQKGLNTAHLHVLRTKLTPEEVELERHPERVFAMKLATDAASPWNDLVHFGGSKRGSKEAGLERPVTFTALEQGIRSTLRKSQYLPDLASVDARYELVRRYWQALRSVFPDAWDKSKEYLVLRYIGVQSFSLFAANVIDRGLSTQDVEIDTMETHLRAAIAAVDWHKDSPDTAGLSGNRGARLLCARMVAAAGLGVELEQEVAA